MNFETVLTTLNDGEKVTFTYKNSTTRYLEKLLVEHEGCTLGQSHKLGETTQIAYFLWAFIMGSDYSKKDEITNVDDAYDLVNLSEPNLTKFMKDIANKNRTFQKKTDLNNMVKAKKK